MQGYAPKMLSLQYQYVMLKSVKVFYTWKKQKPRLKGRGLVRPVLVVLYGPDAHG